MRDCYALVVKLCAVVAIVTQLAGCGTASYLAQQGAGQLRLLRARRRIADVLADPAVDEQLKERLRLAQAARDFGVAELGLRGGDAFTRFLDTAGAPIAWNVTAAPKDRLRVHLRRFPIVGAIPYLGFFREADAQREAARLRALDLDVYVRPVAGYSTLGITADPIYSSMLDGSEARIVEVVLHEMLHGTLYLPGHSEWNESLATFVGLRGAAAFFARSGGASASQQIVDEATRRERDEDAFARFLLPVMRELDALYSSPLPRAEKLRRREDIFQRAQADYLRRFPPPAGKRPGAFAQQPLNNAVLLSFAVYHDSTPEHRRLFQRVGEDLPTLIRLYKYAVEMTPDALAYLKRR
jgi:predicted aminopeptidase